MRRRRAGTGVKFTVENLSHKMRGDGSEIIVRGAAPCWIGHGHSSLAGRTVPEVSLNDLARTACAYFAAGEGQFCAES